MARGIWTVPNEITFLRLGLLPLFIILVHSEYYKWALAVLIVFGMDQNDEQRQEAEAQKGNFVGNRPDAACHVLSSYSKSGKEGQIAGQRFSHLALKHPGQ